MKMKQIIVIFALVLGFAFTVSAQTTPQKKEKKEMKSETTQLKDHVCTSACTPEKHVYAHGEKGHVCTDACKKMEEKSSTTEMKDHVCTTACKDGKHVYAHGEKGHVCTDSCKKKMM